MSSIDASNSSERIEMNTKSKMMNRFWKTEVADREVDGMDAGKSSNRDAVTHTDYLTIHLQG